ncbi:MAG TPA: hypothetical protein VN516_07885, partial [Candidatus Baltobacteraceae bacterium]|nr:hypothetical protein [Candidatus Baltobacteraceae bacterium]
MKQLRFLIGFLFLANNLVVADNSNRLFIPFLEPESQSNVTVIVSALGKGQPCPSEFANSVSNTNLFTSEEQQMIRDIFVKYKNVTTNSGPPGTVLINFYKTNFVAPALYWVKTDEYWRTHRTNEEWISEFEYTNSVSREQIRF